MKKWLQTFTLSRNRQWIERSRLAEAPSEPVPDDLHDSIMRSIRSAPQQNVSRAGGAGLRWFRWVPATALAVGAFLALLAYEQPPRTSSSALAFSAPATTLDLGNSFKESLPVAVMALSEELDRVQQDLDQTTDFLAASLPQ